MKKQTMVASWLLLSLIAGTTSAAMMWDNMGKMEQKMNNIQAEVMTIATDEWENVQVQVKEIKNETKKVSWGMVEDMWERAEKMMKESDKMMKDSEERAEKMMKKMEERGEWIMENAEKMMEKSEERLEKAKKYAGKKVEKADTAMEKYMKKIENKNKEEKILEFKKLNEKIDSVMAKYMNADISDAKKESYKNLFEYIKALNEEKISELENSDA